MLSRQVSNYDIFHRSCRYWIYFVRDQGPVTEKFILSIDIHYTLFTLRAGVVYFYFALSYNINALRIRALFNYNLSFFILSPLGVLFRKIGLLLTEHIEE